MMTKMREKFPSFNATAANYTAEIAEFLESPMEYLDGFHYDSNEYMFTMNPQFLFFGYASYLLNDRKALNLTPKITYPQRDKNGQMVTALTLYMLAYDFDGTAYTR